MLKVIAFKKDDLALHFFFFFFLRKKRKEYFHSEYVS